MAKSYLVYEKRTREQLPVAVFDSQQECAEFLGISACQVSRIVHGVHENPYYGIFVDIYDENEGQYTATTAPYEQRTDEVKNG